MRISKYFIWLLGTGMIIILCLLVSDFFPDKRILYLDGTVLIVCYSLLLHVYGGLYVSEEDFSNEMPATGVKFYVLWTYIPLAILCVFYGLRYWIPFKWQLFIQTCLLFFVLVGLLMSKAAINKLAEVDEKSKKRHANTESLADLAQQMQLSASLSKSLHPAILEDVQKLAERVGFITPSSSSAAAMQEGLLRNSVNRIISLVTADAPVEQINGELENAKRVLSQRLKTY